MIRITEKKVGKKCIFLRETFIEESLLDSKTINIQNDIAEYKGRKYYLLYDSNYHLIEDTYDFLNHRNAYSAENSLKAATYALKYLYIFSEIMNKKIQDFKQEDFQRLQFFLLGISTDGTQYQYNLLTKRSPASVKAFFSVYREFYRHLNLDTSPLFYTKTGRYFDSRPQSNNILTEVPKYISVKDYQAIISYIRQNIKDNERRLRDECIIRIMYEGGCRIGEVLGATLEDFIVNKLEGGSEICFMYIRNRTTDRHYQKAKTCMNISSKKQYDSGMYTMHKIGYQLTFLSMDLYDTICDYIDIAHDRAYKKYRKNYDTNKADAVDDYKKRNENNYYLFLNNRGEPLSDEGWNKELREIFKNVGLVIDDGIKRDNLNHRFRHGFIMHLIYDLKIPREQVAIRARHRNYASLDAYYNPTTEQIINMKNDIQSEILGDDDYD